MPCVIGAGDHAGAATNTSVVTLQDKAVFVLEGGLGWAVAHTDGIVAVIAETGHENPFGIWVLAFVTDLYPCPPGTQGNAELRFAGGHAGHASNAFPEVDYH